MLAAAPDAAPALNTTTRTSPRAFAPPPLAVVVGVDVAAPPPDCGVVAGVVLLVLPDDDDPLVSPDGPLSITCRSTMPRMTARPTSPAPRIAEFTAGPSRERPRPAKPVTVSPGRRVDPRCAPAGAGCGFAARA